MDMKAKESSSPTHENAIDEKKEIILEGSMLKCSSRGYQWNERYFRFQSNSYLHYYGKKESEKPKGSFLISQMAGCEVSELYASQKQNQHGKILYCFKVSWPGVEDDKKSEAAYMRDDASLPSNTDGLSAATDPIHSKQSFLPHDSDREYDDDDYLFEGSDYHRQGHDGVEFGPSGSHASTRSVGSDPMSAGRQERKPLTRILSVPRAIIKKENEEKSASPVQTTAKKSPLSNSTNADLNGRPTRGKKGKSYAEQAMAEQETLKSEYLENKRESNKMMKKKVIKGTKVAVAASAAAGVTFMTAGAGLVAGLAFLGVGAAAGGSAVVGIGGAKKKRTELIIASYNYEDAKVWRSTFDAHLQYEVIQESTWGQLFVERHGRDLMRHDSKRKDVSPGDDLFDVSSKFFSGEGSPLFEQRTQWQPLEGGWASFLGAGVQGLRIFREEKRVDAISLNDSKKPVRRYFTNLSIDDNECSAMKAYVVLNASPVDAFMCLMSYARVVQTGSDAEAFSPQSEQRASFRVIERIDGNMDVVHLVFRPMYLFPSWTSPRDFVLIRYWREEPDGSYVVCYESVKHKDCPPHQGFVRGDMHMAFSITPRKMRKRRDLTIPGARECLMTALVQVDPKGWVPISPLPFLNYYGFADAFGISALLQLLDIRDAIDRDRFNKVTMDIEPPNVHFRGRSDVHPIDPCSSDLSGKSTAQDYIGEDQRTYDYTYAARESSRDLAAASPSGLMSTPKPFALEKWAEPDANSFFVRGKNYLNDRVKIHAGSSVGRLVCVDIVEVDKPIFSGFSMHPTERIQLALQKEKILKQKGLKSDMPPYIFVVNIVLPSVPCYQAVFYYAIDDMSTIDGSDGTPSSKLCSKFFFGDSDQFRHATFKLIPQIVQGNFIVRKAVGSTPAVMGKKLRQLYVKGDRFFEVILDCGSSSVATGVIGLSLGYAKSLVVDMAFLFEGNETNLLPERIFGVCRVKNPDFSGSIRKVKCP